MVSLELPDFRTKTATLRGNWGSVGARCPSLYAVAQSLLASIRADEDEHQDAEEDLLRGLAGAGPTGTV
jgi:hypothetical protein